MKAIRTMIVVFMGLAFLLVFTTSSAQAQCCYYVNPLLLPFAVAGAVLGTAATIVTGIVPGPPYAYYGPSYYAPPPRYYGRPYYYHRPAWVPGYYDRYGGWVPGYWRRY